VGRRRPKPAEFRRAVVGAIPEYRDRRRLRYRTFTIVAHGRRMVTSWIFTAVLVLAALSLGLMRVSGLPGPDEMGASDND
jgi:hypothetical protein